MFSHKANCGLRAVCSLILGSDVWPAGHRPRGFASWTRPARAAPPVAVTSNDVRTRPTSRRPVLRRAAARRSLPPAPAPSNRDGATAHWARHTLVARGAYADRMNCGGLESSLVLAPSSLTAVLQFRVNVQSLLSVKYDGGAP